MAEKTKDMNKNLAVAKLNNCPTSPRKMRIVADLVRGKNADQALDILRFSQKEASRKLEKLLMSAISNWQAKNKDSNAIINSLVSQEITNMRVPVMIVPGNFSKDHIALIT